MRPAPGDHGFVAQLAGDKRTERRADQEAREAAALGQAGIEPASRGRRVLGHEDYGTAVLTAHRQPLENSECHQDDRRGRADLAVIGHQADGKRRRAHGDHGDRGAPPCARSGRPDGRTGSRPPAAPHRPTANTPKAASRDATWSSAGKKARPQDRRHEAVDREVIPLERVAQRAGQDRAAFDGSVRHGAARSSDVGHFGK